MSDEDNVVYLDMETTLDIPVERVLSGVDRELEKVMVIGWDIDGELWISSSFADEKTMNYLLDKVKQAILEL